MYSTAPANWVGGIRAFPKGISPKMNAIARQEFELNDSNVAVQHVSHYNMGTPPRWVDMPFKEYLKRFEDCMKIKSDSVWYFCYEEKDHKKNLFGTVVHSTSEGRRIYLSKYRLNKSHKGYIVRIILEC